MKYRKDGRTTKQFAEDIANCTRVERELMQKYVAWLNQAKKDQGISYTFADNGIGNDGKLLPDNEVDARADFVLMKNGAKPRLIDIKFSREYGQKFRLKFGQVEKYIKDDVAVVVFMAETEFCVVTPAAMKKFLEYKTPVKFKPWGYKLVLEIDRKEVKWYQLSTNPSL